MEKTKVNTIFNSIFITLLFALIIGNALFFSTMTHAVFEVNKLLWLRLITMVVCFVWFFKYLLFKDNDLMPKQNFLASFKSLQIGLGIPLLLWLLVNILSTIFSQNIRLSILGSYDRWEGIITIINYVLLIYMYAKLVTKQKHFLWLVFAIILSASLSSVYGVLQSLNIEFFSWSMDSAKRVFACINNPVHYSAYVGMIVPLCISCILYLTEKHHATNSFFWTKIAPLVIFLAIVLIYYNQFLSYSRATWIGFIGAMTIFYLLVLGNFNPHPQRASKKLFFLDFFVTSLAIAVFYLYVIFNFHLANPFISMFIFIIMVSYLIFNYFILVNPTFKPRFFSLETLREICFIAGGILLFYFLFLFNFYQYLGTLALYLYLALGLIYIFFCKKIKPALKPFFLRIVIMLIFSSLQFVSISWTSMYLYLLLMIGFYCFSFQDSTERTEKTFYDSLTLRNKNWLLLFILVFAIVLIIPTMPAHLQKLISQPSSKQTQDFQILENVYSKVDSYKTIAIQGSARTSMWRSALPWIKDFWLLGSGPDTIKYMYPDYREPQYGILEGGHNFTPDRLHNEYLNILATKGILGFIIYYLGVILGWYILILNGYYQLRTHAFRFFLAGCLAGVTIYLGQVMFNFGVVATLVLFYIFMGLGLAIIKYPDFRTNENIARDHKL